jgi:hypothetical protein
LSRSSAAALKSNDNGYRAEASRRRHMGLCSAQDEIGGNEMSGNWKSVKEDLDWSINKGDQINGRDDLKSMIQKGDHTSLEAIAETFKIGQRDGHKVANFLRCAHEDPKRLYALSRRLVGAEQS